MFPRFALRHLSQRCRFRRFGVEGAGPREEGASVFPGGAPAGPEISEPGMKTGDARRRPFFVRHTSATETDRRSYFFFAALFLVARFFEAPRFFAALRFVDFLAARFFGAARFFVAFLAARFFVALRLVAFFLAAFFGAALRFFAFFFGAAAGAEGVIIDIMSAIIVASPV
jgi:hypothetical protein